MKTTQSISPKIFSIFFLLILCSQIFGQTGDRIRLQQQATFGYSPALDNEIAAIGIEQYINSQLTASGPTNPFPDTDLQPIQPRPNCNLDTPSNCYRDSYTMYPLQKWFFQEALYGNAQLRHRVAWALSQMWVTSAFEITQSRHMTEYYKLVYKHALGLPAGTPGDDSYRGLMREMTLNAAMGEYLDMAYSQKASGTIIPNENYPRELLQLFTTGVNVLETDPNSAVYGKEKLDGNGRPIPVYTQSEINEFAKVFTGWSFCNVSDINGQCPNARLGVMNFIDPMKLNPIKHDESSKTLRLYIDNTFITQTTNGTNGDAELDLALNFIFNHPNVPIFVSKHLIQHLVTSNPSPQYLKRIADVFTNDGTGKRGNMKAVVKAILLDPEARGDSKTDPFGKLREPVQYATNILRAFGVKGISSGASDGVIFKEPNFLKMGQRPFYSPSVFNYYSPKNVITIGGDNLLAPEFGLMTPTTAVARANFARKIIFDGINIEPPRFPNIPSDIPFGTALDLTEMENYSRNSPTGTPLVNALNTRLLNGTMPIHMRNTILSAVTAIPKGDANGRAKTAIYLVVTSAEYQVQR